MRRRVAQLKGRLSRAPYAPYPAMTRHDSLWSVQSVESRSVSRSAASWRILAEGMICGLSGCMIASRLSGFQERRGHVAVSDVAREADVAEQTVYNYFRTKEQLVTDRDQEIQEFRS